jgi:hypothetical protein
MPNRTGIERDYWQDQNHNPDRHIEYQILQ